VRLTPFSCAASAVFCNLVHLGDTRGPGGVHAAYRTIKVFLRWWKNETDLESWKNPIEKVTPPKVDKTPKEGISMENIEMLLETCDKSFLGSRDRAIILALVDSGLRRAEFIALNIADVNMNNGSVFVRHGKGNKPRTSFFGNKCLREITRYLRHRENVKKDDPLWVTQSGERLSYDGLRQMIRRRCEEIGIEEPGLHSFRRTFALQSLRNGCDIYSLMRMMGHESPETLQRYIKQTHEDIARAHDQSSPADNI
jgi:integrase/recombinase XerD